MSKHALDLLAIGIVVVVLVGGGLWMLSVAPIVLWVILGVFALAWAIDRVLEIFE